MENQEITPTETSSPDGADLNDCTLGRIAYDAYCKAVGGLSVRGDKLPAYADQCGHVSAAWERAALAVSAATVSKMKDRLKAFVGPTARDDSE